MNLEILCYENLSRVRDNWANVTNMKKWWTQAARKELAGNIFVQNGGHREKKKREMQNQRNEGILANGTCQKEMRL